MNVVVLVENIRLACELRLDTSKLIDALIKYMEYIESCNMIDYANDKLFVAKDILLQNERDECLKMTRVMVHLEDARILLEKQKEKVFFKNKKESIQHKINQICYELAMLHKWMGNHPDTIKKYVIDCTSLKHPTKDYLGYLSTNESKEYFIMSREELKFLLTEEQYREYMEFYCRIVPEVRFFKQLYAARGSK